MLQTSENRGKLLTVRDGFLLCPICRQNKKLLPVLPTTSGSDIVCYCQKCKHRVIVNIDHGLCFESPCLQAT